MEPHPVYENKQEEGLSVNIYVRVWIFAAKREHLVRRMKVFRETQKVNMY